MPQLAELFIGVALGEKVFTGGKSQEAAANKVWDTLTPVIKRISEARSLDANSTADVIVMLKEGKLSLAEARELMQMLSTKSDIEDMKALLEKMEALGSPSSSGAGV